MSTAKIQVIDSHTGGEPTRVVVSGGPDLGRGTIAGRRDAFREHFDDFRRAVVNEPRGSDVLVGALLCEPFEHDCDAGVIFFNNVGYINMCGHGTIGLAVTLEHLGRIQPGTNRLDTPVGVVEFQSHGNGVVSVENVPSYRFRKDVQVTVDGYGTFVGDVAWGGNWFYLIHQHQEALKLANAERLTEVAWAIRRVLPGLGITGADGAEIDHIELLGPSHVADSKNFVLCPGKAYDRSPCGTGTSAKVACLVADGKLRPGEKWRQESIVGSIFEATARVVHNNIIPTIKGSAYITAESTLFRCGDDPYRDGISAS